MPEHRDRKPKSQNKGNSKNYVPFRNEKNERRKDFRSKQENKHKDAMKETRRNSFKHDCHMGGVMEKIKAVTVLHNLDFADEALNYIEGALGVFFIMKDKITMQQLVGTILLYVKTHIKGSILKKISHYIEDICGLEPHSACDPEWLNSMKNVSSNWTQVLQCEGFSRISKLLSLCISVGLCSASHINFNISGVKLFSLPVVAKHSSAVDFIDAVVTTVTYFVEAGYRCFQVGNVSPLLYNSLEQATFEDNFLKCHSSFEYARTGNLAKFTDMDENDFECLLQRTLEQVGLLLRLARSPVEKTILSRKQTQLQAWQITFQQTRVHGGLRIMPYAIGVFGRTGQGKTSVSNIMMAATLCANGFDASDDRVVTLNEQDKYMSNYRAHINGIIIDDIGNTKPDYVEKACTQKVIEIVNNQPLYAVMAEVEMKGKIAVEPKTVVLTSNVKELCANVFSNEPASVVRRVQVMATVEAKAEVATRGMLDPNKVAQKYPDGQPVVPDLWDITLERAYPLRNPKRCGKDVIAWEQLYHNGKKMENVNIYDFIEYVKDNSNTFFNYQKSLVHNSKDIGGKMSKWMDQHDNQFGELLAGAIMNKLCPVSHTMFKTANRFEQILVKELIDILEYYESDWKYSWLALLPADWYGSKYVQEYLWRMKEEEYQQKMNRVKFQCFSLSFIFLCFSIFSYSFIILQILPLYCYFSAVTVYKEDILGELMLRNDTIPETLKYYRDSYGKYLISSCAVIGTLYTLAKVWKMINIIPAPQGNLNPSNIEEIEERDSEVNPWAGVVVSPMPCTHVSKTTSIEELVTLAQRNLCYVQLDMGERKFECNSFFPCSNVALMPNHIWLKDEILATFVRHSPGNIGGNFKCTISRNLAYHIPETDLSLVWIPNGGDWKDLTKYFPLSQIRSCPFTLVYKNKLGDVHKWQAMYYPEIVASHAATYEGGKYDLPINTFFGLCMAPIVTETNGPTLGGFHLGGRTGSPRGIAGLCTLNQLRGAMSELSKIEGIVLSKNKGTMKMEEYDIHFFESPTIHYKSPIRFLPFGSNCEYYGQVKGRNTYRSAVEETEISPIVEKICDFPNKWAGPKFNSGWPWQASLQYSTNPSCGVKGDALIWAINDYKQQLYPVLDNIPQLVDHLKPLTEMEILCGKDGVRFIDKMPVNTSAGYPLNGPKKNLITELDSNLYPDFAYPCKIDDKVIQVAKEMEALFLKGERAYPIFKACLKDEPTKMSKDKVRVFQGAPVALQMLVRKYYLPVARILSLFPLLSECAVGINSQGPEWNILTRHITRYGKDRILAGDYSKYDLRMPAQVMFAAFRILIDMAKLGDYSEDDICIMEGIATEICYPLMAYNGDLIQHYGSNPSGQNLTVYINSIVNALLFRCAFYTIVSKEKRGTFRQSCSLMTYGDDAKSSVNKLCPEFNHISVADYLKDNDMVFTMPDKEAQPTAYMTDEDADFLKRKSVYNHELDMWFGALDEDSIFKSLHSILKSKAISNKEQCMQNIDGALREWFGHGRQIYEMRRSQMNDVAREAKISHGCNLLTSTYDDLLLAWCTKYRAPKMPDYIRTRLSEKA